MSYAFSNHHLNSIRSFTSIMVMQRFTTFPLIISKIDNQTVNVIWIAWMLCVCVMCESSHIALWMKSNAIKIISIPSWKKHSIHCWSAISLNVVQSYRGDCGDWSLTTDNWHPIKTNRRNQCWMQWHRTPHNNLQCTIIVPYYNAYFCD